MIPGTSRSAIITKVGKDQIAVEVHRINDMLFVEPQENLEISSLYINVGFVTTTLYHGPHPYEAPDEWQRCIQHVIQTWRPEHCLIISSGTRYILRDAKTLEFVDALKSMNFDVYEVDEGLICHRM